MLSMNGYSLFILSNGIIVSLFGSGEKIEQKGNLLYILNTEIKTCVETKECIFCPFKPKEHTDTSLWRKHMTKEHYDLLHLAAQQTPYTQTAHMYVYENNSGSLLHNTCKCKHCGKLFLCQYANGCNHLKVCTLYHASK